MLKLSVLGIGKAGLGVSLLAKSRGYDVFASDSGYIDDGIKSLLNQNGIIWEEGGHNMNKLKESELIIKSPGISPDVLKECLELGIEVYSDIEFAYNHTEAELISITGTNGKTTTANLVYSILKEISKDIQLCGNIGYSFCDAIMDSNPSICVLELSSFQLDFVDKFNSKIAIIMNIDRDHLDRYSSIDAYVKSKFNIVRNQSESDFLIFNYDDKNINNYIAKNRDKIRSNLIPFSCRTKFKEGAWLDGDKIFSNFANNEFVINRSLLKLKGEHNMYNYMASILVGLIQGYGNSFIERAMVNFSQLEHRMEEFLVSREGVVFINDSKATNVHATYQAINNIKCPIIWIMGGYDKNNLYTPLLPLVRDRVKVLVCISKKIDKIVKAFKDNVPVLIPTDSMNNAVKIAVELSKEGDNVLLSPACSSIDTYKDYRERGNDFKKIVNDIYK